MVVVVVEQLGIEGDGVGGSDVKTAIGWLVGGLLFGWKPGDVLVGRVSYVSWNFKVIGFRSSHIASFYLIRLMIIHGLVADCDFTITFGNHIKAEMGIVISFHTEPRKCHPKVSALSHKRYDWRILLGLRHSSRHWKQQRQDKTAYYGRMLHFIVIISVILSMGNKASQL